MNTLRKPAQAQRDLHNLYNETFLKNLDSCYFMIQNVDPKIYFDSQKNMYFRKVERNLSKTKLLIRIYAEKKRYLQRKFKPGDWIKVNAQVIQKERLEKGQKENVLYLYLLCPSKKAEGKIIISNFKKPNFTLGVNNPPEQSGSIYVKI